MPPLSGPLHNVVERFNALSAWCTYTVLTEESLKGRVKVLGKMLKIIKVPEECVLQSSLTQYSPAFA